MPLHECQIQKTSFCVRFKREVFERTLPIVEIRHVTAELFLFLKVNSQWNLEMLALQKQIQVTKQFSLVAHFITQHWYNYQPNETLELKTTKIYTNFAKRGIIIFFPIASAAYIKLFYLTEKQNINIKDFFFFL